MSHSPAGGRGGGRGPSPRHRGGGSGRPSPALLTSYIKKAWTVEALFETCSAHQGSFNHIHVSACWNKLGQLARAADRGWPEAHAQALQLLMQHTTRTVSTSSEIRARELANIAHGVAKSGVRSADAEPLMAALARSMERRLGDCNPQELANTAWAFAKAGHPDPALFTAVAGAAERRLGSFNAQELTNTAWAFATAGQTNEQLFIALAQAVGQRLGDFNTQGLANTSWAFAKAGHTDPQLFKAMAKMAQQRLRDFNSQDIANTAWAFAKAGHYEAELFTALARSSERHLSSFNAQGLANTAWAFAKAGHSDPQLYSALAKPIERRLGDFNSQDLANTAWAFAKACHPEEQLFAALSRSAERCLDDFNTQDLVNTAWAFAKVGHFDSALFDGVARTIEGQDREDLTAPLIANIAWAFARAGQLDEALFATLSRSAERRVGELSAQQLASVAWAFANAGQLDERLFASLAKVAERMLDDFDEEELDNLEWAFVRAGQQKIVQRLRQRRRRTAGTAAAALAAAGPVDVSGCGRIIIAGGGIGGAAAAVALQAKGFDVTVLEADSSFDARKQGYGLTIQRLDATQALGISLAEDDAPSTSHYTFSAEGRIINFYGEAFGSKSQDRREFENSGRFVHLPRQALRARILEQIRPGTIKWNSRLKGFKCRDNGVAVTLQDGSSLDAALLVGSDGIFSTVRRQLALPGDRLNYVGFVVVLGIVDGSVMDLPLAHRRIFETVDGTTRVYAMPFTTSSTMWQLSFPCAEVPARAFGKDTAALKAEILRRCEAWHDPIPALLKSTPLDCMSGYPVYDRELLEPDVLRRPAEAEGTSRAAAQRRVTLIGDAAHPMTPFKAQGANQALVDAVLLSETLVESIHKHGPEAGFDAALPLFEQKMLARSARAVVGSRDKARELHSSLALQPARKAQRETGVDMQKVIRALQSKGIGAQNATDPRGLDAAVAAAAGISSFGDSLVAPAGSRSGREASAKVRAKDGKKPGKGSKPTESLKVDPAVKKRKAEAVLSLLVAGTEGQRKKKKDKKNSRPAEKPAAVAAAPASEGKSGQAAKVNKGTKKDGHDLEAVTLRLLKKKNKGQEGMKRLKLRKQVLAALQERGSAIDKLAVRQEWESLVGTSARFKVSGDTVYAV